MTILLLNLNVFENVIIVFSLANIYLLFFPIHLAMCMKFCRLRYFTALLTHTIEILFKAMSAYCY
jgi:hypothetical protein